MVPLCLLLAAAWGDVRAPDQTPEQPPEAPQTEDVSHLEALPYATWSETDQPELRGVEVWDRERAWEGVNLYTNDADEAYLMDMAGRRLHAWQMPEGSRHCEHFELLRRGEIVAECQGQWLARLDASSEIVWLRQLEVHHDVHVEPDGSLITLRVSHRKYQGRRINFGSVVFLDPDGEPRGVWDLYDSLAELKKFHPVSRLDDPRPIPRNDGNKRYDYYHLNAIESLPDTPLGRRDRRFRAGNLLLSLRNVNTVLVVDRDSRRPVWSWGAGEIERQHTPTMLSDGNLLIFDNGSVRGHSRVVEVEPESGTIVWSYDPGEEELFSRQRGSAQRLPNGNTLICESAEGRVIEVTPDGEIVWEFWSTSFDDQGRRRRLYRMHRLSRAEATERMRRPPPDRDPA